MKKSSINIVRLFLLFLLIPTCFSYSQEYPDNIKEVTCFSTNVEASPWGIRLAQTSEMSVDEIYTPLCGDLDNDGIPEIVVTQGCWWGVGTGKIVVFEGTDISKRSQLIDLGVDVDYYSGAHVALLRMADQINPLDTIGLIIVLTKNDIRSYKYDGLNNITLFKQNTISIPEGTIAISDFNNDGKPEVYCGNMVFDAYSLNLIGSGNSNSGASYFHWNTERVSYAADVLPSVPGTELICGSVIYSVDVTGNSVNIAKTITPPSGFASDGQTEVADFNGDGLLDVLVKQYSSQFGVYAYDPRTGAILFSKSIASGTEQNFPMIGDIDADGKSEVVLLYKNTMKAYKYDGTDLNEFWSIAIQDASGSTGMTLFDFNQDGLKEIVYRDEVNLRIINGSKKSHLSGADTIVYNLSIFPVASKTIAEFPIVVDCDADGEAEIVLQGRASGSTSSRLHMFKSMVPKTWAPARSVWNQYAYNVTNVNNDLTIPSTVFNNATFFPNGKQPFNNFQEQATTLNQNGDMVFELIPDSVFVNDTICEGDLFVFNGDTLTSSGIYVDSTFCDSVVVLSILINSVDTTRIDTTIFQGQSYTFGTKVYTTAATDTLRLKNVTACDSIVILNLLVKPSDCSNGTLFFKEDFGGNNITDDDIKATGIPQVSGYTYIGPGQTATSNRTYFIRKIGYGNGDWHRLDDHTYFNDYTRGYLLQVDASYTAGTFYKVTVNDVCPGTKLYFSAWAVNSMVLWRQNNLSATSPNISFVIKDAATNSVLLKYDTGNIPNDSTWYPADYSYAGWLRTRPFAANWMKYGTAFTVPSNVDSLIFTLENNTTAYTGADFALDDIEIHICVPPVNIQGDTICAGEPLTLTGNFVNDGSFVEPLDYKWQKSTTGEPLDTASWIDVASTADLNIPSVALTDQAYYRLLVASMGNTNKVSCRAASNSVYLKVNVPVDTLLHDSICKGDSYIFNSKQLTIQGIYKDTLTSSFGCDSIVTLNLSYYKIDTLSVYAHPFGLCEGDYTVFYGDTLRTQGVYYHTHSCDTVYKLQLLIKPRVNIEIEDSICRGNSYTFNGKTLFQSGVYLDTIPSLIADLCDTLITLTLNYKKDIRNDIYKEICQGDTYDFEGTILNTSGIFTHSFPATHIRCDSILVLHLMLMPPDTTYLTISITEGKSFWFGGNEITTTGRYYNQLTNKLNCDSVVILNLNVITDKTITVPEIFTPNGDGNNDFFEILNIEKYPKNHILILNRWGNKVYEGKPYMNEWDGRNYFGLTVGGNELPVGTYFYILDLGNCSDVRKGYVYLNR